MSKHLFVSLAACMALRVTQAQDCSKFLFLQKDKTIEVTIYDKKGEPNGRQVYQVGNVTTAAGVITGTINSEIFDKSGYSKGKANSILTCNGGEMRVDMKLLLSPQQSQQFGLSAEASGQNGYLSYPNTMKVGDQLPDGNLTIDLSHSSVPGNSPAPGAPLAPGNGGPPPPPGLGKSLTMVINNRKVDGQESVTTSAGTWNCFRISFKSKVTVKTGPFGFPVNIDCVEWYAPGLGIVKTQSKAGGTAITSIK
jgi:hypothetical protein